MSASETAVEQLFTLALNEDLGQPWQDATSDLLFADTELAHRTQLICKHPEPIILCGLSFARQLYQQLDPRVTLSSTQDDGDSIEPGESIAVVEGDAKALLRGERVVLNFLRHLSAIATLTQAFVKRTQGTTVKILDTRKTTPGMRSLEKYAVQCGGGVNHRMGLYDAIMIKDTHVDLIGGMQAALAKLPSRKENPLPVIVEVRDLDELDQVLKFGEEKINRVLLDNMTCEQLKQAVKICNSRVETEASGNINLDTITAIAQTGVDYASVGMISHSAGNVDLSMRAL